MLQSASLGQHIRALRIERVISQATLAEAMGVSRPAVAKWEAGKSSPDTTTLKLLADFFQVSSDFLLGRTDRKGKVSEAPAVQEVTNEAEESGELPIPEMLELRLRRRAEREGLTYREFVKRVLEKAVG